MPTGWIFVAVIWTIVIAVFWSGVALPEDRGQWDATPPEVRRWYQTLMQPDVPTMSCCGEADAYWADSFRVEGDNVIAIITDDRIVQYRRVIPNGTEFVIPKHKYKFDAGNPTGHGVIFIGAQDQVYCYVPPGGV